MPKMKIKLRATYTLLACLLVLFSSTAIAQTKVSGTVTDADSKPLKGATVSEKGTTRGTVTDDNGEFFHFSKIRCEPDCFHGWF